MYEYIPSLIFEAPPFPDESFALHFFTKEVEPIKILDTTVTKEHSIFKRLTKIFLILGFVFLLISYGPSVWYVLNGSESISSLLSTTVTVNAVDNIVKSDSWQPPFDKNLPLGNSILIPSAGIETNINEASDASYEDALREGVWRVNNFGTPYDRSMPTILTAHRFGYLSWSLSFRLHQSFYNLPKLDVGDTLSIVWRQRKYTYAVYKSEENTEITDYSADLILYTCRDLTSNIREIKYARLIEH